MAEVESAFVIGAPNGAARHDLFAHLRVWVDLAVQVFDSGRLWIDGGFVTHKAAPPHDVDVVLLPDNADSAMTALRHDERAYALLTLQDVFFVTPSPGGTLRRLQPVGGTMDAFLADPRDNVQMAAWHDLWSSVKGPDGHIIGGQRKGYVEVRVS